MDMDRLQEWLKIAQQHQGGDFWKNIFENKINQPFLNNAVEDIKHDENIKLIDFPRTDVYLTETHILVLIELPGIRREDILISSSGNKLYIKVHVHPPFTNAYTVQNERVYGEHERTIELPEPIDRRRASTSFVNGLMILGYERSAPGLKENRGY